MWGTENSPSEDALNRFMRGRAIKARPDQIRGSSLAHIEFMLTELWEPDLIQSPPNVESHVELLELRERIRHQAFSALCGWERRLGYADVNERIFERFRSVVDATLAEGAPQLLDQFSAVYRRLRDARRDPSSIVSEDLAHAVTSCRRILKAVADHVLPGAAGATSQDGNKLDDPAYRNRVAEYIKRTQPSESSREALKEAFGGLLARFRALDGLASKGVHGDVGIAEAELCAISTYIVAGELLSLAGGSKSSPHPVED
jgi:hypothetical protein